MQSGKCTEYTCETDSPKSALNGIQGFEKLFVTAVFSDSVEIIFICMFEQKIKKRGFLQ